jgi:glutaredoxin
VTIIIFSKPDCHLCDDMKKVVRQVLANQPDVSLEEIDISDDPDLLDRYGLEIPVLMIDGKKAAKYRISEEELTKVLRGRT